MKDKSKYSISCFDLTISSAIKSAYKFSTVAIYNSFNLQQLYNKYLVKLLVKLLQNEIFILYKVEVY